MTERNPLSISVNVDTNKMQLKLRAIAKHTAALADELDAIDNAWQCEYCGHNEYVVHERVDMKSHVQKRCKCAKCNEKCVINEEMSMHLEGTD